MGENLKGEECRKGICRGKDGLYSAGVVNKRGKSGSKMNNGEEMAK